MLFRSGYRYALMGLVLSIFLGEYFFVEPFGTFDELTAKDVIITLNFVSATLAAVYLIEKLHRSAYAGELLLKVTQSRQLISLQRENDRLHYARKSSEAWSVLTLFISDFDRVILFQYDHEPPRLGPLFYQLAHQPIEEIEPNDWLTAIHPDDRDSLLNCLRVESTTRYKTTQLRVRFTADAGQHELAVELQILRFTFMNKPLWILSERDRKSTRLNSSHTDISRMPSSA